MLTRYTWRTLSREIVLVLAGLVFCIPLYLLLTISLKPSAEAYTDPIGLPLPPTGEGYITAMTGDGAGGVGLGTALVSSAIITVGSVVCLVLLGTLAAFVIARRQSRWSTGAYLVFVLGLIIPFELGLVPLYVSMRQLGLVGNYIGMILLYTGLFMPLTVFLYTGFVRTLPRDYEEAAQVDGASQTRVFLRVVMPLLLPVTGTVAILDGLFIWNQFFTQLVFLSGTNISTVPVTVYLLAGANVQSWNVIFAAATVAIVPVFLFFLFAQRTMIRGFSGGVKG